jgi:hypothetical protein
MPTQETDKGKVPKNDPSRPPHGLDKLTSMKKNKKGVEAKGYTETKM